MHPSFGMFRYQFATVPAPNLTVPVPEQSALVTKQTILCRLSSPDGDVLLDKLTVTLRCPLSHTRIVNPVRCHSCTHLQCFDLASYVSMNQTAAYYIRWKCPVCAGSAPYNRLISDRYFVDVLKECPVNIDTVELLPDGGWRMDGDEMGPTQRKRRCARPSLNTTIEIDSSMEDELEERLNVDRNAVVVKQELVDAVNQDADPVLFPEVLQEPVPEALQEPVPEVLQDPVSEPHPAPLPPPSDTVSVSAVVPTEDEVAAQDLSDFFDTPSLFDTDSSDPPHFEFDREDSEEEVETAGGDAPDSDDVDPSVDEEVVTDDGADSQNTLSDSSESSLSQNDVNTAAPIDNTVPVHVDVAPDTAPTVNPEPIVIEGTVTERLSSQHATTGAQNTLLTPPDTPPNSRQIEVITIGTYLVPARVTPVTHRDYSGRMSQMTVAEVADFMAAWRTMQGFMDRGGVVTPEVIDLTVQARRPRRPDEVVTLDDTIVIEDDDDTADVPVPDVPIVDPTVLQPEATVPSADTEPTVLEAATIPESSV